MKLDILREMLAKKNKFIMYGTEEYFLVYAIEQLKQKLSPDFLGFNYIEIDQKTEPFNSALLKLESVPMMDTVKLVHIKNFNFSQGAGNNWNKEELSKFLDACKSLDEGTNLLLSNMDIEINSKFNMPKLMKDLSSFSQLIPCDRLNQIEIEDFIKSTYELVGGDQVKLGKANIKSYLDTVGYVFKDSKMTLLEVSKDIEKLAAISHQRDSIDMNEINQLFKKEENTDIFKLMDSIFDLNKEQAFVLMEGLLSKGEPISKIAITIGNTLSVMIKASYLLEMGYTQAMISDSLSKHPYVIKSGLENLRKIGRKNAVDCLDEILKLDVKLKTGKLVEEAYPLMILINLFKVLEADKNQDAWAM